MLRHDNARWRTILRRLLATIAVSGPTMVPRLRNAVDLEGDGLIFAGGAQVVDAPHFDQLTKLV